MRQFIIILLLLSITYSAFFPGGIEGDVLNTKYSYVSNMFIITPNGDEEASVITLKPYLENHTKNVTVVVKVHGNVSVVGVSELYVIEDYLAIPLDVEGVRRIYILGSHVEKFFIYPKLLSKEEVRSLLFPEPQKNTLVEVNSTQGKDQVYFNYSNLPETVGKVIEEAFKISSREVEVNKDGIILFLSTISLLYILYRYTYSSKKRRSRWSYSYFIRLERRKELEEIWGNENKKG